MKTVVKSLLAISLLAIIIGLIASGTVNLRSTFGVSADQFVKAREKLRAEDFGAGIYLGGSYNGAVDALGKPKDTTEFGTYRSAKYLLPVDEKYGPPGSSSGQLSLGADEDVINEVIIVLGDSPTDNLSGMRFLNTPLEQLRSRKLIEQLGSPSLRYVSLGEKVYAWYLFPLFKNDPSNNTRLTGSVRLTARFSPGDDKLIALAVRRPN